MIQSDQFQFVVKLSNGKIISNPMSYNDALQVFINLSDQVSGVSLVPYETNKVET